MVDQLSSKFLSVCKYKYKYKPNEESKDLKAFPDAMYHIIEFNPNRTTIGNKQLRLQLCRQITAGIESTTLLKFKKGWAYLFHVI